MRRSHNASTRSARHRTGRAGGFTLIELLVGMTVTIVGLAGLLAVHVTASKANRTADQTARATALCETTLEELRGQTVAQVVDTIGAGILPVDEDLSAVPDGTVTFRRHLRVEELSTDPDLVRFRVDIDWSQDGATAGAESGRYDHTVSLELIRTKLELL